MLPQIEGAGEEDSLMGVCASLSVAMGSLTESPSSVPAALTFEKFIIPDPIRILDGVMETLTY